MRIFGSAVGAILAGTSKLSASDKLAALGLGAMFAANITGTNGAGNAPIAEIKNPNASGKTLFFWAGDAMTGSTEIITAVIDGTSLTPAGTPVPMLVGGAASVALVGGGNQLAPTGTAFMTSPNQGTTVDWLLPPDFWLALPPNHNLQFQGSVVASTIKVNLRWIELAS